MSVEVAELTPAENSYFESGGQGEIPTGEAGSSSTETTTETTTEQQTDPNAGNGADKTVSLAALHEERTRRREIAKQLADRDREIAELKGKFSILDRLVPQGQKETPAAPPNVEEDIFGAVKALQKQLAERENTDKTEREKREAAERETAAVNNLVTAYRTDAAQFKTQKTDFDAAYAHLLNSRARELQRLGYSDPAAISQALQADEIAIVKIAVERGDSPAAVLYELAQERGYRSAAASGTESGKGAAKIEAIQRGQATNKSLNGTGGAAGETDMTAERLLSLPNDEFEKWVEKNPAKARRLMGG